MTDIQRKHEGPRMSLVIKAGGMVYTAGLTAERTKGGSVTEQAGEVLERVDAMLAEAGTDKSRLISAQIWLTDIATFSEFNAVWDKWVADAGKPVRACVEAPLADPALNVEIMVTALA